MSFQVREALRAPVPPESMCDQLDAGRSGRELGHQVGAWGGEGPQAWLVPAAVPAVSCWRGSHKCSGVWGDDYWFWEAEGGGDQTVHVVLVLEHVSELPK